LDLLRRKPVRESEQLKVAVRRKAYPSLVSAAAPIIAALATLSY
jgi:hypothetical protein